ncbi:hypothetical protein RQP46_006301 [Phenoliferia psychrophenolica]
MPTTIASLPPEILADVFCEAGDDFFDGIPTLKRLSLVCRSWREPAERNLYGKVRFSVERNALAWIESPRRHNYTTKHLTLNSGIGRAVGCRVIASCPALVALQCFDWKNHSEYHWCSQENTRGVKDVDLLTSAEGIFINEHALSIILGSSSDTFTTLELSKTYDHSSNPITAFFTNHSFPLVHTLDLYEVTAEKPCWTRLMMALPALTTLRIKWIDLGSYALLGASVTPKLETLVITGGFGSDEKELDELLRVIKLPTFQGLHHLEYPSSRQAALAGRAGLTLLKECEERLIYFKSRDGYLYV